ncbi:MAG: molybdopterin molybdotransferase MoeA [Pseudanabaenaceae cyanobacterium bins.68]|nr:molybdopterin molybdotransferase MoeA [Pseudanabaenaceae cyanobacterium bins.68]
MAMISVAEAEKIMLSLVSSPTLGADQELVPLSDASGRVLAQSPTANLDFPPWANSAMDGYAVRCQDLVDANQPIKLKVVDQIPAGKIPQVEIQRGEAARIFTGAMLPPGADTVVMQEHTRPGVDSTEILILEVPQPSAHVRQQGDFYRAGSPLLQRGKKIGAPELAILAAAQCAQVWVYRRPRVAIFSTGDELVTIDQPLAPGQIVDSNSYAIAAFLASRGAEVINLGIVRDQQASLRDAIAQALATADLVISSGGVSVGDYDYVEQVLADLGGEIAVRSVAIKPGKPLTIAKFAQARPQIYFGLPGNPVSALVSCWRFVDLALQKWMGISPVVLKLLNCITATPLPPSGLRETYVWGRIELVDGTYHFHQAPGQQISANLINLAHINGLAIAPTQVTSPGNWIKVLAID